MKHFCPAKYRISERTLIKPHAYERLITAHDLAKLLDNNLDHCKFNQRSKTVLLPRTLHSDKYKRMITFNKSGPKDVQDFIWKRGGERR